MGTRASFFIGDPRDVEKRKWLGCVAWDGFPDGDIGEALNGQNTEDEFVAAVAALAKTRDDFTDPAVHGFPFPWADDLFLTDFTYALFDGGVQVTSYHRGFVPLTEMLAYDEEEAENYGNGADTLATDCPAPGKYDSSAPDSIMILGG